MPAPSRERAEAPAEEATTRGAVAVAASSTTAEARRQPGRWPGPDERRPVERADSRGRGAPVGSISAWRSDNHPPIGVRVSAPRASPTAAEPGRSTRCGRPVGAATPWGPGGVLRDFPGGSTSVPAPGQRDPPNAQVPLSKPRGRPSTPPGGRRADRRGRSCRSCGSGFRTRPARRLDWPAEERCESGRIGLTANELTRETGSEGSNPSLSARPAGRYGAPPGASGQLNSLAEPGGVSGYDESPFAGPACAAGGPDPQAPPPSGGERS